MHTFAARPVAIIAWSLRGSSELVRRAVVLSAAALALATVAAQPLTVAPPRTVPAAPAPVASAPQIERVAPITVTGDQESFVLGTWLVGPLVRGEPGAVDTLVAAVAARYERAARDAELRAQGDGFAIVPSLQGVAVDRGDLASQLVAASHAQGLARTVRPRLVSVEPTLNTSRLAATTLVAEFSTSFPRNPARATNIKLAATRFDGQIVKPGETFSFWTRIGEVTYEAGFVDAGAIINGRSDKALAGGICQVSTTLFNAVARAGYRIDERHAHSYYIERYPIGLDAAVLFPSEDFRWTNDTEDPVLIRGAADDTRITFRLFSVPSGRVVSFGAPSQINLVMPAADQPADPAYPAGYVVRGRDVVATRTVSKDAAPIHRDAWLSHYRPVWGGAAPSLVIR